MKRTMVLCLSIIALLGVAAFKKDKSTIGGVNTIDTAKKITATPPNSDQ